ncbi:unnamed protein product [Rotaria sp. Silwood1]|nr:unnamed protein product [Rotaria sp. Silwood1]CAF3445680.1 unnamed protein product [Rotaria sp. Silwood1]CAF3450584.1 unnamed protein product [Rotaria sp. Silwood1]CAF4575024.1 unnamed protein product [Rotaria sp. Silwood1]CAF4606830.1 unnamed protein product [Rotaria sp. Silwood1]
MAWVERMLPSDQDEQFESWRKEFQQERLLRIVREREIMKETAKRCKSYKIREQEANDALERKRHNILAQRKAANVQATMRFQRNLPGFTVMDQNKFDQAIETITGRQLSNRSTPRRPSFQQQQQRLKPNTILRRSISMEELGSRQQISNNHRINQKNQILLTRTNSVTQVPQYTNQVQYTSPLQEVQRRVLNDFAAQIQSTLNQNEQFNETNTWERESMDSLEASNHFRPQQIIAQPKITGPIVRPNHVVNIQTKRIQQSITNNSTLESITNHDQQEMLRRSYHESFFVKNTPVTGDEQVTAWLGANKISTTSNKHVDVVEKPVSLDGNDPETNGRRKSILKRSPSVDSNSATNTKPIVATRKERSTPQVRTIGNKGHVKDSLEVINAKLLKELETQKKTVRFAQDSNHERCASDTQLVKEPVIDNEQTSLRRVQSAALLTPPNRQPIK